MDIRPFSPPPSCDLVQRLAEYREPSRKRRKLYGLGKEHAESQDPVQLAKEKKSSIKARHRDWNYLHGSASRLPRASSLR
jgi:hypothetical protein